MEAEIEPRGRGLVIFIPTSRDASSSGSNSSSRRTICIPNLSTPVEEEMVPSVSSSGTATTTAPKGTQRAIFVFGTSSTIADSVGVAHDSIACNQAKVDPHSTDVGHQITSNSAPALSQCTEFNGERTRTIQSTYRLPDLSNELSCSLHAISKLEAKDALDSCKYVDIQQSKVRQNLCSKNAYHIEFGASTQNSFGKEVHCTSPDVYCSSKASRNPADGQKSLCRGPTPGGHTSNWLKVVKPEVNCPTSLGSEESWPPLLACSMKGETPKPNLACHNSQGRMLSTWNIVKPLAHVTNEHENTVLFGANIENRLKPNMTQPPHGSCGEVLLDEQCWPSLEQSCRQSDLQYDYGHSRKRTLQPLGRSTFQCQQVVGSTVHNQKRNGGPPKTENVCMPPILLMLNKDFIVTSPLRENLLLTLALMGKPREDIHSPMPEGEITRRQILVGQFKAFSSFLNFMLGRDATRVRTESNAGGTSTISESLSVEYFVRRFQAKDVVTEMEVEYCSFNWKKVDYICTLYGQRVGVSVTRAMSFPDPKDFSAQMAYRLLYKKLFGLVVARHGVSKRHSFSQCILHVWCETQQAARIMQKEYDGVSQELDIADDVVMVLTVADGSHARPIFYESVLRDASH